MFVKFNDRSKKVDLRSLSVKKLRHRQVKQPAKAAQQIRRQARRQTNIPPTLYCMLPSGTHKRGVVTLIFVLQA